MNEITFWDNTRRLIEEGIEKRYYPSAVCAIGDKNGLILKEAFGYSRWFRDESPCFDVTPEKIPDDAIPCTVEHLFDMASCSKVMSTTLLALKAIENGEITLSDSIWRFISNSPEDKKDIEILDLMTHRGGFAPWFDISKAGFAPEDAAKAILSVPLEYETGREVRYSCMGYILLGKILELVYGAPLDVAAEEHIFSKIGMKNTLYTPLAKGYKGQIAPTEYNSALKKYKEGIVHDENSCFLNGISGNAGVFSTAKDVAKLCMSLGNYEILNKRTLDKASINYTADIPGDDRGLGFVVKGERLSSSGDLFSNGSIGHTGYTGTFFFIDKETSFYFVLLTNRVHFTRENIFLLRHRRKICNSAISEYFKMKKITGDTK
ncbi:MAG: beta-lactamase family protein [Ruminococcaceae bacterium]|nr:beta-lactamase family protein [Oscillospiraceae bacterium]